MFGRNKLQRSASEGRSKQGGSFFKSELAAFDACIEAADAIACCEAHEDTTAVNQLFEEDKKGIRVSPDGQWIKDASNNYSSQREGGEGGSKSLLGSIIDQDHFLSHAQNGNKHDCNNEDGEYIIIGKDEVDGDLLVNGFTCRGWAPSRVNEALKRTVDSLGLMTSFVEDLSRNRMQAAHLLGTNVKSGFGRNETKANLKQGAHIWISNSLNMKSQSESKELDILQETTRENLELGPLFHPSSSLRKALDSVERYYVNASSYEKTMWRKASQSTNIGSSSDSRTVDLKSALNAASRRVQRRENALYNAQRRVEIFENRLQKLKEEASKRWRNFHALENEILKKDKETTNLSWVNLRDSDKKPKHASNGYVFELGYSNEIHQSNPILRILMGSDEKDLTELESLRVAAVAAENDVEDAATDFLNALANVDTTRRSARVAAEGCLLGASKAQERGLKSLISTEKEILQQRLKLLEEAERAVDEIDVREDLHSFIESDKAEHRLHVGDDDAGIASALAVLNSQTEIQDKCDLSIGGDSGNHTSSMWSTYDEVGIVSLEEIGDLIRQLFFFGTRVLKKSILSKDEAMELENVILFLEAAVKGTSKEARAHRTYVCFALNQQRSVQTEMSKDSFNGLSRIMSALLTGCTRESSDIASAKMCMMLSQTFYTISDNSSDCSDLSTENSLDHNGSAAERTDRVFVKSTLLSHKIWDDDDFWESSLFQCVSEALIRCKVLFNLQTNVPNGINNINHVGLKWHDLTIEQRLEAASQTHSVLFSQLGALSHSMIEFGCDKDRAKAFVRKLAVRYQMPFSQKTLLLEHVESSNQYSRRSSLGTLPFDSVPLMPETITLNNTVRDAFTNSDAVNALSALSTSTKKITDIVMNV